MDNQIESIFQGGFLKKVLDDQIGDLREKYNLKKAELMILYFLSRCAGRNTSTDIHYQLVMNKGQISKAVESLCEKKLIVAVPDERDRRYVHYKVSDSAQEIIEEVSKRWCDIKGRLLEGVSEDEIRQFCATYEKIKGNIKKWK